jgi:hypothetical protein
MNNYETAYGVTLMDDLHNFFPAILYTPDIFNTTQELLQYIANQTRDNFNVYNRNLRSFLRRDQQPVEVQTNTGQSVYVPRLVGGIPIQTFRRQQAANQNTSSTNNQSPRRTTNQTNVPEITTRIRYTTTPTINTIHTTDDISHLTSLSALFSLLQPTLDVNLLDSLTSVRVTPTREQIRNATTIRTAGPNDVNMCSICQENYETTHRPDTICEINHCQHSFHNSCLMRWFDENTRCPVCRWDIRSNPSETTPSSTENTNSS